MELVRKRKNFHIVAIPLLVLMFIFPVILFGQDPPLPQPGPDTDPGGPPGGTYTPLVTLPNITYNRGSIGGYLGGLFNFFLGLAALLAVVVISFGGIQYITTDAIQGKSDGKAKINQALLGLLLALAAFIILNTINPDLVNLNLDPRDSGEQAQPGSGGDNSSGG